MNVGVKLTAFAAVTTAVFGLAFGVGSALDPIAPEEGTVDHAPTASSAPADHPEGGGVRPTAAQLPGLAVASRGYTLRVDDVTPGRGEDVQVAFRITGPDGSALVDFDTAHDKQMHLIVVRRDMANFQHLHPERDAEGTWRVAVDLPDAGVYRFFADFSPTALGEPITLGADVFAPGAYTPAEFAEPSANWSSDGYEVTLAGRPAAGAEAELTFTVTREGTELTDLEPYLGAFGHLVSLRTGDLAYLHTHPAEGASADRRGGPSIRFGTTFPTAGRYRLYLNFAHGGEVRTAEFTVEVPAASGGSTVGAPDADDSRGTEPTPDAPNVHSGH